MKTNTLSIHSHKISLLKVHTPVTSSIRLSHSRLPAIYANHLRDRQLSTKSKAKALQHTEGTQTGQYWACRCAKMMVKVVATLCTLSVSKLAKGCRGLYGIIPNLLLLKLWDYLSSNNLSGWPQYIHRKIRKPRG